MRGSGLHLQLERAALRRKNYERYFCYSYRGISSIMMISRQTPDRSRMRRTKFEQQVNNSVADTLVKQIESCYVITQGTRNPLLSCVSYRVEKRIGFADSVLHTDIDSGSGAGNFERPNVVLLEKDAISNDSSSGVFVEEEYVLMPQPEFEPETVHVCTVDGAVVYVAQRSLYRPRKAFLNETFYRRLDSYLGKSSAAEVVASSCNKAVHDTIHSKPIAEADCFIYNSTYEQKTPIFVPNPAESLRADAIMQSYLNNTANLRLMRYDIDDLLRTFATDLSRSAFNVPAESYTQMVYTEVFEASESVECHDTTVYAHELVENPVAEQQMHMTQTSFVENRPKEAEAQSERRASVERNVSAVSERSQQEYCIYSPVIPQKYIFEELSDYAQRATSPSLQNAVVRPDSPFCQENAAGESAASNSIPLNQFDLAPHSAPQIPDVDSSAADFSTSQLTTEKSELVSQNLVSNASATSATASQANLFVSDYFSLLQQSNLVDYIAEIPYQRYSRAQVAQLRKLRGDLAAAYAQARKVQYGEHFTRYYEQKVQSIVRESIGIMQSGNSAQSSRRSSTTSQKSLKSQRERLLM